MAKSPQTIDPRRQELAGDPHRPAYHFLAPANWMNDPNGTIFWNGEYHLFYQYNPNGAFCDTIHWGHAVSEDMVHWKDLPIALAPTPGGPDRDGCWSGCAVDDNGVPTVIYWGNPEGICVAASDDAMLTWEKSPDNPVIAVPAEQRQSWKTRDPCAWREGDTWYLLSGSYIAHRGGIGLSRDVAFMFRSADLVRWEYMHPLYDPGQESDCAVPDFFPLGEKHVLLFASHTRGGQYYVGTYADRRFTPERHGRMNFTTFEPKAPMATSGDLVAPISWADATGRRIMIAWIAEGRSEELQRASGWAGVMSLPRVLSLAADGALRMEPAPELRVLRRDHRQFTDVGVGPNGFLPIEDARGDCLEIAAVVDLGDADEVGLKLRRSPNGEEETVVSYNTAKQRLTLDVARSSLSVDVVGRKGQTGPLELRTGEPLKLDIFVDRSVVEIFANGRQCLTKRIYPSRPDSLGLGLFALGGTAQLESLHVWHMSPIWPV